MRRLKSAVLLAPIIALLTLSGQVVFGDSKATGQLSIILADRRAASEALGGIELTQSVVGLVSALRDGEYFAFMSVDQPDQALGPISTDDPEFGAFKEEVMTRLLDPGVRQEADLARALAATYNLMGSQRAAPGSNVYLITGGSTQGQLAQSIERLQPIVSLFRDSGWPIVGLSLPGSSSDFRELLSSVSRDSGGDYIELSVPGGFPRLANKILKDGAKGSLAWLGEGELKPDAAFTSTLSIAPGTSEATIIAFKTAMAGSLTLNSPSGVAATTGGERPAASIVDTPHAVIWRLTDPAPGQWRVDARSLEGAVSTWQRASNGYGVALERYGPVPTNQPATLIASVTNEGKRVVPSGAKLLAKVTSPDGTALAYELSDGGTAGDSVPGDGYFTAVIPNVAAEGKYTVELELSWPEFGHQIASKAEFSAQAFPAIEITPAGAETLRPGERGKVATLFVHVKGQPYAVSAEELVASLASNSGQTGTLELKPQGPTDQGRAWMYDVFITPQGEGLHTAIFRLNMEYAGRRHLYTSDYMVLPSAMPVPAAEPVAEAPATLSAAPPSPEVAPPVVLAPVTAQVPPVVAQANPFSFPWERVAIPLAVAAALAVGVLYWRTRPRPYGYLYDDRDALAVDFANFRRNPIMTLLFRSAVRGKELGLTGLENAWFRFAGDRVGLRSGQVMPTIRVDNQPLIGQTTIHDRTRIGSHGRLYTFLLSPPGPQMQPGVGDGN